MDASCGPDNKVMTKAEYEQHLNDLGEEGLCGDDRVSEGGRIPDNAKLGTWTRRNDPIAFNVGFQEMNREEEFRKSLRR